MTSGPPLSSRTDPLFPSSTLFRSARRAWLRRRRRVLRRRGGFHRRFCNSRGLRRLTFILHVGFSSERFRYFLGGGTCGWLGRRRRFLRDGFGEIGRAHV